MTKAILTTKIDPTYDDLPEERYHFPPTLQSPGRSGFLKRKRRRKLLITMS